MYFLYRRGVSYVLFIFFLSYSVFFFSIRSDHIFSIITYTTHHIITYTTPHIHILTHFSYSPLALSHAPIFTTTTTTPSLYTPSRKHHTLPVHAISPPHTLHTYLHSHTLLFSPSSPLHSAYHPRTHDPSFSARQTAHLTPIHPGKSASHNGPASALRRRHAPSPTSLISVLQVSANKAVLRAGVTGEITPPRLLLSRPS